MIFSWVTSSRYSRLKRSSNRTQNRSYRVSELVRASIASAVLELEDILGARLTVTAVEMSPDLKYAHVYWVAAVKDAHEGVAKTASAEIRSEIEAALEDSRGDLQSRVARETGLRFTPIIRFNYDKSEETKERIDSLLKGVSAGE